MHFLLARRGSSAYLHSMSVVFKHCSNCKKEISFSSDYYKCSVSTCNHQRTGLFFCSVVCWDAHVPEARHRDAWAEPMTAPSEAEYERSRNEGAESSKSSAPRRVVTGGNSVPLKAGDEAEILVVVSKLKKYVRDQSGMNTSDNVMPVLSAHLRWIATEALREAAVNERKTVLDRDVEAVLKRFY